MEHRRITSAITGLTICQEMTRVDHETIDREVLERSLAKGIQSVKDILLSNVSPDKYQEDQWRRHFAHLCQHFAEEIKQEKLKRKLQAQDKKKPR